MRDITKGREPRSLIQYRMSSRDAAFDDYRDKDELRRCLVREQLSICCYCMNEIKADSNSMKIEHWRPESRYHDLRLHYGNLLASCHGGDKQPQANRHCDTLKGNRDLKFNPANPSHRVESRIKYGSDGSISATDDEFSEQLDKVLGLNISELKSARKAVLDAVIDWFKYRRAIQQGPVPRAEIERKRDQLLSQSREIFKPYGPVALWWLNQRIKARH